MKTLEINYPEFMTLEFEDDSVSTDRGLLEDRKFILFFKQENGQEIEVLLSPEEISKIKDALSKYNFN